MIDTTLLFTPLFDYATIAAITMPFRLRYATITPILILRLIDASLRFSLMLP